MSFYSQTVAQTKDGSVDSLWQLVFMPEWDALVRAYIAGMPNPIPVADLPIPSRIIPLGLFRLAMHWEVPVEVIKGPLLRGVSKSADWWHGFITQGIAKRTQEWVAVERATKSQDPRLRSHLSKGMSDG